MLDAVNRHSHCLAIRTALAMLTGATALGCSDDDLTVECIAVDPQVGDPIDRQWCDGEYYPSITWEGELASRIAPVCLPSEDGSSCKVCPADEVSSAVEAALFARFEESLPECTIQHWELGCMRTIEITKMFFVDEDDPNFCCFETAVWGPGCEF